MAIGGDGTITLTTKIDDSGIKKGTKSLQSSMQGVSKALKGVAVASAGALATVTTLAVKSYAEYEQLVGGVDTLFKGSSKQVQTYADEAYKTAGLSANDYMSTVTSFSASLLQSLGGDTQKAAGYANQAVIDMSDNANKMGTSMEMIQNAYQGFAKQNYTMLDNLKLGYGGTKEEMSRLLEDASKISGIKYDISSFADVTQAIHVMQQEMGIAGTTALEASSTIQGSINTMKGAWSNLMTAFADPNGNVDGAMDKLIESIKKVAENLLPILGQAFSSIFNAIPTPILIVVGVITSLVVAIETVTAVTAILNAVMAMNPISLIIIAIVALVATFAILWVKCEGFRNFWIGLWEIIKSACSTAWEAISGFFISAWEDIKVIWNFVQPYFNAIWESIKAVFSVVTTYFKGMFETAWTAIKVIWDAVAGYFTAIWDSIKLVFEVVKDVLSGNWSEAWEGIKAIVGVWKDYFIGVWDGIKSVFTSVGTWFSETFMGAWNAIKTIFSTWGEFFGGLWDTVKEKFVSFGTKIGDAIGSAVKSGINGILGLVERTINKAIGLINGAIGLINLLPGVSVGKVSPITIPKLAQGAVLPPNKPFMAMVGDQKSGTNIEAPLQTIVDAFNIALQGNANYGGGNTEVVLEIDGREFGRAVLNTGNQESRRLGTRVVFG